MTVAALEKRLGIASGQASRWALRAGASLADQALVSGANFLLVVLFGRWLRPEDYGAVSVGLAVFLLAANFYHALLLEPMSVLGPRHFSGWLGSYFVAVAKIHGVAVLMLSALVLGAAGLAAQVSAALAHALAGLAASIPFVLTYWLLRRICYVLMKPAIALRGGVAFMLAAVGASFLTRGAGSSNAAALFLLTGFAAFLASLVLFGSARARLRCNGALGASVIAAHWSYGRWMAGVSVTYWLANSAFPVLLGWKAGLAASAGLRALENLVAPVLQVTGAMSLLLLPWVSGQAYAHGIGFLRRYQRWAMTGAAVIVGSYLACVLVFRRLLLGWLYGSAPYQALASLAPVMAAAVLIRGVSDLSFSLALKGAARPEAHFVASLVSTAFVATGGTWLVEHWAIAGAAWTMLLSNAIQAAVLAVCFVRLARSSECEVGRGSR